MRVRDWRALLAAAATAIAVTAGVTLAATPAAAVSDGTTARIMAKSTDGKRFYLMPTGELRPTLHDADLYTFVAKSCGTGNPGVCYEIQSQLGNHVECLFYWVDYDPPKIQYGACGVSSLQHRWHVDSMKGGGVRLRPASHPLRCGVYDPAELTDWGYTYIERCSSSPASHLRFWLAKPA